jgi:hypothetical protein
MRRVVLTLSLAIWIYVVPVSGQLTKSRLWEPFEVTMSASTQLANPYVDGLPDGGKPFVVVTFTGLSGDAKGARYSVPGFWDGDRVWKVRFAAPATGVWSYAASSTDSGLRGAEGKFECVTWNASDLAANPSRHGFVRVARNGPRAGRYFEYSDGTPFLWIGDTWWPFLKSGIPFTRARQVIDDRSSRGFTVGQVMFAANSATQLASNNYSTPNLDAIRQAERFITYANSRGVVLWIMPWWSGDHLNENPGREGVRRWTRYMVHRLAAYNVIWNIAGEYNMDNYGGLGLQFWKELGGLIRREDPYQHAIGAHNTPPGWTGGEAGDSAQWSTGSVLHDEPWLDFNGSQVGHGKWRNEMIPQIISLDYARKPAKPVVVTEPWYEFIEGSAPAMDVRFAAWSAILSGAAGHTYGGGHQWWADIPGYSAPRKDVWPSPPLTVDTLDYPGAASIGFLAKFLKGIQWWKFEPHPEIVHEYPQSFASAIVGEEYLVYARYGGQLKLDLRSTAASDVFRFTWIDLVDSKPTRSSEDSARGGRNKLDRQS